MEEHNLDQKRLYRYFTGNKYNKKDSSYVNDVFCDNTKVKALKSFLLKQFNELLPEDELHDKNLDHILYRIHYDINNRKLEQKSWSFDHIIKWTIRIAGIIILPLAILLGIYTFRTTQMNRQYFVEIKAPAWSRVQFSLPDNTTGWLNNNSSIKYKGDFNVNRQVTLSGEAFFDVSEDKERPFIVNTNEVSIKALGTRFNVVSYDNEKEVEVVLVEGKLEFMDRELFRSYTMRPNDMVVYDKKSKELFTTMVQTEKYSSWIEGKLVFRNDPIDVIARRLERYYNVNVVVDFTSSEDIRWRATFIDEDLEEVLTFLKSSLPVDYKIENGNLGSDNTYYKKKVTISHKIQ